MRDLDVAYERAVGLVAAALDEKPGEAFRAVLADTPEIGEVVDLLWIQASLSATLIRALSDQYPNVSASEVLQRIALRPEPSSEA